MSAPVRRALALLVVVSAAGVAWWWTAAHHEALRAAAGAESREAARELVQKAVRPANALPQRVLEQATSLAKLPAVKAIVSQTSSLEPSDLKYFQATFADAVKSENWLAAWLTLGTFAFVIDGTLAYASTPGLTLVPRVEALVQEAVASEGAQALFVDERGRPMLAAVARVPTPTVHSGAALVVLLTPLTPEHVTELATRAGAPLAVVTASAEVLGGDPRQAQELKAALAARALDTAPCCAEVPLAPGVRLAAWADPGPALARAEAEWSTHRLLAWGVAGLLAVAALFLGFRGGPEVRSQLLQETTAELARSRAELTRLSQLVPAPGAAPASPRATDPGLDRTHASVTGSRYVEVAPLGEGGMARVSVAEVRGAEGFKRFFVVKRLKPELTTNPEIVNQFIDEARLGASLVHSNIVPVFDFGRDAEGYFLAQEYILGRDVDAVVETSKARRGRPLEPELVLYLAQEALKALSYAHGRADDAGRPLRLVHRDVSPSNLMVSARGEVKLLDFGIVKSDMRLTRTQTGVVKGNLYFMSPEQARALEVDARSDLFSLGMVLYSAAAGRPLYSGNTSFELINRAGIGPTPEDRALVAALPAPLNALVARALEVDPARRYRDADEFARAVAQAGGIGTAAALQGLMEALFHDEFGAESGRLSSTRVTS